ncbi:MAG: universal stress protein [Myxococcales bacterium]
MGNPSQKKILCPVDFSPGSETAIEKARELAGALGAELELLHAYQMPVLALPDSSVTVSPTYLVELTNRAQQELDKHATQLEEDGITTTTRVLEGNPAETIVDCARDTGATMIVMGTHGRSGFRRFLLGSTAERVVRMATVPVLTVHVSETE